jgi:hypothetical protein
MVSVLHTEFSIKPGVSLDDLLELSKAWVAGMTHSAGFGRSDLSGVGFSDGILEAELEKQDNRYRVIGYTEAETDRAGRSCGSIGILYSSRDSDNDGRAWKTTVVGKKCEDNVRVAVTLDTEFKNPTPRIVFGKTPYMIKQLIRRCGPCRDGKIELQEEVPYAVPEKIKLDQLVGLLIGRMMGNSLPIVYISIDKNNEALVSPKELTKELSGLAHIFVDGSAERSFVAARSLNNTSRVKTVGYGGGVSIHFPGQPEPHLLVPKRYVESETGLFNAGAMYREIVEVVKRGLSIWRPNPELSWEQVWRETVTRRLRSQLTQAEKLGEYVELLRIQDEEMRGDKERIARFIEENFDLERQVNSLSAQTDGLRTALRQGGPGAGGIELNTGAMEEAYPGHFRDILLDYLRGQKSSIGGMENSVRRNLLQAILEKNASTEMLDQIEDRLKAAFSGYRTLTPKIRETLGLLGLSVQDGGKHYSITSELYPGVKVTMANTCSDVRAGMNIVHEILNKFV